MCGCSLMLVLPTHQTHRAHITTPSLDSVFPGLQNSSLVHSIGGDPCSTVCRRLLLLPFLRSNHTGIRPAQGFQSYVSLPLLKAPLPNILWLTFFFFRFLSKSYFLCETWRGGGGRHKTNLAYFLSVCLNLLARHS